MRGDDPLRALLHRKVRELSDGALERGGEIPADQLDAVNRLARLLEVRDKSFAAPLPRWRIAMILAATLVLVSALLFLRVPTTEVELQLVVSEAGFVLAKPLVLLDLVNLAELEVTGLREIQFSDPAMSQLTAPSQDEQKSIRVAAMERNSESGTVTLNPLNLPAAVEVRVFEGRSPARCQVVLAGAPTTLRATLHGPVRIELPSSGTHTPVFEMPGSLLMGTGPNDVRLDLLFASGSRAAFAPQLTIEKLALSRIDVFQAPEGTTTQAVSTILSGVIYLESLSAAPRPLRARELLRFDEARGVIRALQLDNGHVTLAFRGTVRGMRSGWGDDPVSLMPTWLDWLRARHGLSLLWGTTLYLFGLVAAILRWWRVPS
jgi:hypothetical protein